MRTTRKEIVIIGAGYTGLVAALRCAEKGHRVTVLEKGNAVGGLASDFKIEGGSLERAYHHIFKTDTSIISMAKELGVSDKLEWHDSSVAIYYNNKLYPFKGAVDLLKFSPLTFYNRIRAGVTALWLQLDSNWEKYQKISAYDWMRKYAGKQVVDVIWGPLLKGKFDKYHDKVSMAWLWARIHIRAKSREKGGEKLGYFSGGFQVFTDALAKRCESLGVTIKTGVDISSISSRGGVVSITMGGKRTEWDACIATTPSHVFAKLIEKDRATTKEYLAQLNSINYLGARLLVFSSSQYLSQYYWHNINDTKLPFLVFINHTNLVSPKFYGGKYVYYIATYLPHEHKMFQISDKDLKKLWFNGLKKIFPAFNKHDVHELYTFTFANAQHIVDNDYSSKIPRKKTPLDNVYLSNFSQIFPEDRGTNFAVREGEAVAQLVLNSIQK